MNYILFIVVLIMYFYFAILPFIGLAQIVGFFSRVHNWKKFTPEYKRKLKIYGYTVLIYFTLLIVYWLGKHFLDIFDFISDYLWFYLIILPNLIALYYWVAIFKKYDNAEEL